MTCEPLQPEQWRLGFPESEAFFVIHALAQLGRHYREDMAQLPPALRAYWQGKITTGQPAEDLKESQEMLDEARLELRSERLALVENWLREFELAENRDPWTIEVSSTERDDFVAMLNDRRLLLGLEAGLTETEMEADFGEIPDLAQRLTVMEIQELEYFILVAIGPQFTGSDPQPDPTSTPPQDS